ncbi:MAG TPA: ABC transporter permease [Symbiobacteriaceae bacterium]|jgi:peptide/nickel transport system permease protein
MPERRRISLRRLVTNGPALVGALLVLTAVACAFLAPFITAHDPVNAQLRLRLDPPTWDAASKAHYLLGADAVGRDVLTRIIYGARISLTVGLTATAISLAIGVVLGLLSGYFGGWLDSLIMRIADVQLSFPFILLALVVMAIFGGGLAKLVLVLGITGWVSYARLVRSQVLTVRELDYVQAARSLGASDLRIIVKHVLVNVISSIIVLSTLQVATNILLEAGLTFLGMGVDPSIPSWGGMLADGRNYITNAWWVATFPGFAIMFTVLGVNLLGDWLRDELDPQLRV